MPITIAFAQLCILSMLLAQTTPAPAAEPLSAEIACPQDHGYPFPATAPAGETTNQASAQSAAYAEQARKTFFAYLAAARNDPIRVAFYDHASGTVLRPVILPLAPGAGTVNSLSLALDERGFIWVCAGSAGGGPATLFKSGKPYDIAAFSRFPGPEMSYPRLLFVPAQGFLLIGQRNENGGTAPYFSNSTEGHQWSAPAKLAAIDAGHTFIVARQLNKVGVALACYSAGQDPTAATNLYYLETSDAGRTWQDVHHVSLQLPVTGKEQGLMAWEYRSLQWTVHLKDMCFGIGGRPVILYLNGHTSQPGQPPTSTWTTARWVPRGWESTGLLPGSSLTDAGLLFLEPGNAWRLFAVRNGPRVPGQEDLVSWFTNDQGRSWYKRAIISNMVSASHVLIRPTDAQPECYAIWLAGRRTLSPPTQPAHASTRPAPGSRPSIPGPILLLNREADAFSLPPDMADTSQKPRTGPVTTRPSTQPG